MVRPSSGFYCKYCFIGVVWNTVTKEWESIHSGSLYCQESTSKAPGPPWNHEVSKKVFDEIMGKTLDELIRVSSTSLDD